MKNTDPRLLVQRFADATVAQTEEIWRGDPQTGNRHAKRRIAAVEKLFSLDGGRDALSVLLKHERPDVRVRAAAYLLRHCTDEALAVLRKAARGQGLVPFEASECIKRWDEGTWRLDPTPRVRKPSTRKPATDTTYSKPVARRPTDSRTAAGRKKS